MVTDVANKDDYECEKNGDLLWRDRGFGSQYQRSEKEGKKKLAV